MRTLTVTFLAALAAGALFAVADDQGEADSLMDEMSSCTICCNVLDHPDLMEHMTWETRKIDSGMICVVTVPPEQAKELKVLNKEIAASVQAVIVAHMQGEPPELCSYCRGIGELMQAGAKQQDIPLSAGLVTLITSESPELVKKIHAHAEYCIAEQEKMDETQAVADAG